MNKKLKIAQIATYYYPSIGGVSGVVKYISEELVKRGHSVDVIAAYRDHKERPKLKVPYIENINGVNVYRYDSWLNIGHMSFMPGLITHLIKQKYDVIHYHVYRHPVCDIGAFFGTLKRSVKILHGHGPFFERGEISKLKHFIYDTYDKFAVHFSLKLSDRIIAFNDYEKNNYIRLIKNEKKIAMVLNAADNQAFTKSDITEFISKYNLNGKKLILCVGIINESKRQDLLIETLPKIIKEVPDAFLILIGPDGGLLETVNQKAEGLNVVGSYKYLGSVSDEERNQAFDSAKLFALASDKDAYPLAIAEAMAHHLPVVATDARGPKDMVHSGTDGFILKKRDVNGIADAIIKLLKDESLRREMASAARLNAEKNHSSSGVAKQLEALYYEVILQRKRNRF